MRKEESGSDRDGDCHARYEKENGYGSYQNYTAFGRTDYADKGRFFLLVRKEESGSDRDGDCHARYEKENGYGSYQNYTAGCGR